MILAPKTSVVFYLPSSVDNDRPPSRTLFLAAAPGDGRVVLTWNDAAAATTYNVLRSTVTGGSYATVQAAVTRNSFTDTTVSNGTTYYYVVTSSSATATSGYSPEASATPKAP